MLLFLIMYDRCRYEDKQSWSIKEKASIHIYQAHMARLTTFSSSTAAGVMHTLIQPVIKMSLKPSPSLLWLVFLLLFTPQQKFLRSFACWFSSELSSSFCPSLFLTWESRMSQPVLSGCRGGRVQMLPFDKVLMDAVRRLSYCWTSLLLGIGIYRDFFMWT